MKTGSVGRAPLYRRSKHYVRGIASHFQRNCGCNQHGQIFIATGSRADIVDKTSDTYDDTGNLSAITNAADQVTTLSRYEANDRAGRITDPNGLVIELGHFPRDWLTLRKIFNEASTYGGVLRLTAIANSAGNRIDYTLDAMGNRIREAVKDPMGQLARQTTRVYDALNRLQQITGGTQ